MCSFFFKKTYKIINLLHLEVYPDLIAGAYDRGIGYAPGSRNPMIFKLNQNSVAYPWRVRHSGQTLCPTAIRAGSADERKKAL